MHNIYMDESGYTGYDLLNKNQPFQATSSIKIQENEAKKLIENYFPRRQSELKHKKLSSKKAQWKYLIEIQKEVLNNFQAFSFVCNKKFLLILMFLDNCVEPYYYDLKIDYFKDGRNYALASLLYFAGGRIWGDQKFEDLLYYYQLASKKGYDININILCDHARSLLGKNTNLDEVLYPISEFHASCINELKNTSLNTDITFVIVLGLISHIEKFIESPYEVVHDNSKQLTKYSDYFKKLININEERKFTKTKITAISFPLNFNAVSQKDSKTCYAIQLADVLVGGITEYANTILNPKLMNDYNQEVFTLYNEMNLIHHLPSLNFEQNKNFRKNNNSEDFIQFMGQNLS